MITITIPLDPIGKERARSRYIKPKGKPGFISTYTPARTRKFERDVNMIARGAMRGRQPFDCPVTAVITAVFPVPRSWSGAKYLRAVTGQIYPTGKPDWDNVGKIVTDAIKGVVFRDDAVIVDCRVRKLYGRTGSITVTVRETAPLMLEADDGNVEQRAAPAAA